MSDSHVAALLRVAALVLLGILVVGVVSIVVENPRCPPGAVAVKSLPGDWQPLGPNVVYCKVQR